MAAQQQSAAGCTFEHADDIRPVRGDLSHLDIESDGSHLGSDATGDGALTGSSRYKSRVNRVDRDEITKEADDVSPENDDRLELQYGGALGVPRTARMGPMKRSKFSEEQVAYALRQAESGTVVGDVCRQVGISEATFYAWKKKYAHLGVNEVRRLRQLEEENTRLKRLVADLSLDKHMLSEALRKKV